MVAEARLDEGQNLLGHRVRFEPGRHRTGQPLRRPLAVVMVEIPLTALGLVTVHQKAGLAPHLAVEILHPQGLAPLRPSLEVRVGTKEPVILQQVHLERMVLQRLDQAPFAGFGRQHLRRAERVGPAQQLARDGTCILRIIEPRISHAPALPFQPGGELAHGGEKKRDLLGVVGDVVRFRRDLGHYHHVARLVGSLQRRDVGRNLVAQHQNEARGHHGTGLPAQSKN